jgi:sec-independent protein translocase protein TatB
MARRYQILMFDVGFSEIVVIAVVALIVIGPERLPKAARTMGHLFGRLQRYVNDVKADINREIELDELRKLQKEVQSAAADLKSSVESAAREVDTGVRNVESELNAGAADSPPAPEGEAARMADPSPLPNEPGGELADATPAEPPHQPSLPGFDKI